MSDDVNIKISATDNASAILRNVQREMLGVGTAIKSFESKVGNAFNAGVFGVGLASLTRLGSESVKMFAESERAGTMLDRVLKSTGNTIKLTRKDIQEYAQQRMGQTIFDDDSIVQASSHLARFRDIAGETFFEAMNAAQDLSTVMGTDLVSATQALGRALTDPVEGMAKLARAGIVFTDQQKNQIKLLELLGDKAGQQRIIINEANRVNGGAAAADAKTPSGIIAQFKNELGESMESIGRNIFPTIKAATQLAQATLGGVPGEAGKADLFLNGPRGAIRGGAAEIKRLNDLKDTFNALGKEIGGIRNRVDGQGGLAYLLSPFQNAADAATVMRNRTRREDLKEEIAIQAARAAAASQREIPSALLRSLLGVGTQGAAGFMTSFGGLTKEQTLLGLPIGTIGDQIARDLNMAGTSSLFGGLAAIAGNAKPFEGVAANEPLRSLQAVESRFLTRGRGQLSGDTKAVVDAVKASSDILKRIERDLNNLPTGMMLVVEGVN